MPMRSEVLEYFSLHFASTLAVLSNFKVPCSQEQSASHGSVQYPGSVHGGSVHGHSSVQHFCAGLGGPRCGLWVVNIVAAKQQARLRQISKTVSSDFHPAC